MGHMTNKARRLNVVSLADRPTACEARQKAAAIPKYFDVSDAVLAQLRGDVMERRVEQGLLWFEDHVTSLRAVNPEHPNTAAFIGYLSQWISLSDHATDAVRELLSFFPQPIRSRLPLDSYLHLRLAEGILNLAAGNAETASVHFEFIISVEEEPLHNELQALAHFWKAQCERTLGNWDSALVYATRARARALAIGCPSSAAMMQALEGCIHIHKGRLTRAMELLREADGVLQQTDDFVWLGNIQSAYGSVALEEGRYELALENFTRAVAYYRQCNRRHPDLPESLVSLAQSKRFIAVRIARAIDTHAERRRRSAACDSTGPTDTGARQDMEQLRADALSYLTDAIGMCDLSGESRGLALARIERGFLLVDGGDFDRAALDAAAAFELSCKMKDQATMAAARLLGSRIESAQYEEGIGDAPARHAQRAHDFAKEALTCALQTDDRRLLASAYLCQGLIFCTEFFNDAEAAGECCRQAGQFLTAGHRNQLWDEYQTLTRKVARTASVDSRLREWSQGLVEGKTFQQMTEEFADLVIPSVWEREKRNVSRVVAKLSISPKKVRRILSRAGLKAAID